MKLSEAMILGSTILKHTHTVGRGDNGCALRCAYVAMGERLDGISEYFMCVWSSQRFRWMAEILDCPECGQRAGVNYIIACCLNDTHHWSIDKIASWVAAHEPQEETPHMECETAATEAALEPANPCAIGR